MFKFLHLANHRSVTTLVLRIGRGEIDFLLFSQGEKNTDVLAYGSEPVQHYTALQVLERIFLHFPQDIRIKKIVATFDSSVFRAQILSVSFPPKNAASRITKKEAQQLEKEALGKAQQQFQKHLFSESGIHPKDFELKKMKILDRKIGGYDVPHLEGFAHREIACSLLGIFLLKNVSNALDRFAAKHNIDEVDVVHVAEALQSFASDKAQPGIYICVEEEKTRVALRNGKTFTFLGVIDIGSEQFADFFGDKIGMQQSTARFLEKRYFEGDLSTAVEEKIQAYLLPETRKFATLLRNKLVQANCALPDSLWVFGRGNALRNLSGMLSEEFLEDLPFSQNPKIAFLLPKDVWSALSFPGMSDPLYTELCLLGKFSIHGYEKKTY